MGVDAGTQVHDRLFIGGRWADARGRDPIDVISPNTGEVIGRVPAVTAEDMDAAVAAARDALAGPWPRLAPGERAEGLSRLSRAIAERGEEIAGCISAENGCPVASSPAVQVLSATMALDAMAELAAEHPYRTDRVGVLGNTVTVRRAPVGVAAAVVPWNVPLFLAVTKLAPALAAGCPIVVKLSSHTPLHGYLLAEAVRAADLPAGLVSILGARSNVGEHLVRHPGVDKVGFTGSTAVGRHVAALCADSVKRVTLELGGKSAAIILEDADIGAHLAALVDSSLMNNGQMCGAQSRILVPRRRRDELVEALVAAFRAIRVGDSLDPDTDLGPLANERQRDRVQQYLDIGHQEGARAATGGGRSDRDRGFFVEPTVFDHVDNSMRIAQEEIFGPVVCVIPYTDEDEAVALANDSPYGLCGSVWTSDVDHGAEVGARIEAGTVTINSAVLLDFHAPFGGFKQSGIGRELGPEGLDEYVELQSIIHPFEPAPTGASTGMVLRAPTTDDTAV
ncbi:MAG: aldehyde dehydrogenase [Acidimicrobiia bacterium]|nr:aldehyde dehydrogenase [Acidimicrobiia bacterium]